MAKNSYTLQLDKNKINDVINYYKDYECSVNNQYVLHHFKYNSVDISIYTSFKVLFMGNNAFEEYSKFANLVSWEHKDDHAGSDEVGTGDFFGPVVVVASYFTSKDLEYVNNLNIKDSKKLNDEYIKQIGPELINKFPNSILILHNDKYNEMVKKGFNMNKLKAYLHNKAYINLMKKVNKIDYFVLDQFAEKNTYYSYLNDYNEVVKNVVFKTKAEDKSPAVAIASLIARYVFLVEMDKLSSIVGFELKKGENDEVVKQKHYIENKFGKDIFSKIAKLNFKTINK